jgi:hypothetical protein
MRCAARIKLRLFVPDLGYSLKPKLHLHSVSLPLIATGLLNALAIFCTSACNSRNPEMFYSPIQFPDQDPFAAYASLLQVI